jgi:hypothetical protein
MSRLGTLLGLSRSSGYAATPATAPAPSAVVSAPPPPARAPVPRRRRPVARSPTPSGSSGGSDSGSGSSEGGHDEDRGSEDEGEASLTLSSSGDSSVEEISLPSDDGGSDSSSGSGVVGRVRARRRWQREREVARPAAQRRRVAADSDTSSTGGTGAAESEGADGQAGDPPLRPTDRGGRSWDVDVTDDAGGALPRDGGHDLPGGLDTITYALPVARWAQDCVAHAGSGATGSGSAGAALVWAAEDAGEDGAAAAAGSHGDCVICRDPVPGSDRGVLPHCAHGEVQAGLTSR